MISADNDHSSYGWKTKHSLAEMAPTHISRGDLIQVFKVMHGFQDVHPDKLFDMSRNVNGPTLRGHDLKINKERSTTRIRQNNFTQRVCNVWNKLPAAVVHSHSTNIFKNGIDEYLTKNIDMYSFAGCSPQDIWKY